MKERIVSEYKLRTDASLFVAELDGRQLNDAQHCKDVGLRMGSMLRLRPKATPSTSNPLLAKQTARRIR